MRYQITLEIEVADSRRSSSDTHRRAQDAAAKITAYAGRLRFVTDPQLVVPGGLKPLYRPHLEVVPDV